MTTHSVGQAGFAGAQALTWPVWLWGVVLPQLFLSLLGNFGAPIVSITASACVLVTSAVALLLVATRVVPRSATGRQRQLWLTGVFLVTGMVMSTTSNAVFIAFGMTERFQAEQIISGAIGYTWFFVLVSAIINDRHSFARSIRRLTVLRAQLEWARAWPESALESVKSAEVQHISDRLEAARRAVLDASANHNQVAGMSDDLIDELLAEIDAIEIDVDEHQFELVTPLLKRRSFARVFGAASRHGTAVAFSAALFLSTVWILTGITMGNLFIGVVSALLAGATLWLGLVMVDRFVLSKFQPSRTVLRTSLAIALWLAASVIAALPAIGVTGIPAQAIPQIGIQTWIVVLIIAFTVAYRLAGDDLIEELEATTIELDRSVVTNSNALRMFRERLRRFVHRDLQSLFQSIERTLLSERANTQSEVRKFELDMADAFLALAQVEDTPSTTSDPQHTIAVLKELWGGLLTIDDDWSPDAVHAIEESPVAQSVLSDVLIEVITNTAKHDLATTVHLELSMIDPGLIHVRSTSHTQAKPAENKRQNVSVEQPARSRTQSGNGLELFDEVCLEWTLLVESHQTRFDAVIPVSRQTESVDETGM